MIEPRYLYHGDLWEIKIEQRYYTQDDTAIFRCTMINAVGYAGELDVDFYDTSILNLLEKAKLWVTWCDKCINERSSLPRLAWHDPHYEEYKHVIEQIFAYRVEVSRLR